MEKNTSSTISKKIMASVEAKTAELEAKKAGKKKAEGKVEKAEKIFKKSEKTAEKKTDKKAEKKGGVKISIRIPLSEGAGKAVKKTEAGIRIGLAKGTLTSSKVSNLDIMTLHCSQKELDEAVSEILKFVKAHNTKGQAIVNIRLS